MDPLIEQYGWLALPVSAALVFVYLCVSSKLYPFLLARRLDEEDRKCRRPRLVMHEYTYRPKLSKRTVSIP